MIRSMTGFAERIIPLVLSDHAKSSVSITIKSLNSRYFEVSCKLPYQLNNLETELTKILKEKLNRGHIYYTIYVNDASIFKTALEPSFTTIEEYINAISQIKNKYPITGDLSLSDLLALPNAFISQEKPLDEGAKNSILATTSELLDELFAAQIKEGKALVADLEQRIEIMHREIDAIGKANESLIELQKEKIAQVVNNLEGDATTIAEVQKHAAYTLLDKMNINEEIVRFNTHLKSFTSELACPKSENGKRLDFTLQEMAREVNTIAAKCSDATIGSLAINIKVELEKAREQVQNIA